MLLFSGPRVLKVYRSRRAPTREFLGRFSHRVFEGKRDPSPEGRWETERFSLALWTQHGFRVPAILDRPPPAWIGDAPYLWLERVEGPRLYDLLRDESQREAEKEALVRRLAVEDRRRHRLALELNEPLLLHEHPTTKHKLVLADGSLCTFDLEGGYLPNYSVLLAVGYEVAGILRSIWRSPTGPCFDEPLTRLYIDAYDDVELLRSVCRSRSRSIVGLSRLWTESWRKKSRSKSAALQQLNSLLA